MTGDQQMALVQDPVLRGYLDEVEALRLDARGLGGSLSQRQFAWRPAARSWSVGQCLDHVTLTLRLYPSKIEAMLAESRERAARGDRPFREGAFTRWFVRSMEPPPRMRVRTLQKVEPRQDFSRDVVLNEFDAELVRFAGLIAAADGVSLRHGRTRSPFFAPLQFTLGQVLALNLAHSRRHLWQARQVTQHTRFPSDD